MLYMIGEEHCGRKVGDPHYRVGTLLASGVVSISLFKGKPSVTAGRKATGSHARQPSCQSRQRPHALEQERGAALR